MRDFSDDLNLFGCVLVLSLFFAMSAWIKPGNGNFKKKEVFADISLKSSWFWIFWIWFWFVFFGVEWWLKILGDEDRVLAKFWESKFGLIELWELSASLESFFLEELYEKFQSKLENF